MNRSNPLKHFHHVDVHNSLYLKEKQKKKYSVYNFWKHVHHNKIFREIKSLTKLIINTSKMEVEKRLKIFLTFVLI